MGKYHSKKVVHNGMTFDSQKEYQRYCELSLLERAGKITDLRRQVKFVLTPTQYDAEGKRLEYPASYKADFVYFQNGEQVVEDVKGYRTAEYILKRKVMLYLHGVRIRET